MVRVIRTKKGLDIRLRGRADEAQVLSAAPSVLYALQPSDFVGVVPKLMVKEGDNVKVGTALFVNKACTSVSKVSNSFFNKFNKWQGGVGKERTAQKD